MLFEKRTYTLRPGCLDAFMQAQEDRGFDIARPILDRLIGYFHTPFGVQDQVVHLYRFDSYDDWMQRLHGLYGVPELEAYFRTVRPLMLAQENEILGPAPLAELTPFWGAGRDALAGRALTLPKLAHTDSILIEESQTLLLPGRMPEYWAQWKSHLSDAGELATARLLGVFTTVVGQQHKVTSLRWHPSLAERNAHGAALHALPQWQAFRAATQPAIAAYQHKLLVPAPLAEMSPLFAR